MQSPPAAEAQAPGDLIVVPVYDGEPLLSILVERILALLINARAPGAAPGALIRERTTVD
jgi:hypothetical protein